MINLRNVYVMIADGSISVMMIILMGYVMSL